MNEEFSGIITAVTPLCHTGRTLGIVSKFNRLTLLVDGEPEEVPVYSGNSIRGILRRCIYYHLLDTLGITEKSLSKQLIFSLKMGGQRRQGEQAKYDTDFECTVRTNLPYISLLGGVVGQQFIHGKLSVGMAWPIARETVLQTGIESNLSVWSLLDVIQLTHMDDREQREKKETDKPEQPLQMLYKVEVLIPGTQLSHSFTLKDATPLERSCFMRMLKEFENQKMTLGGNNRVGLGKIKWTYKPNGTDLYDNWLTKNKDAIKKYLLEALQDAA